MASKNNKRSPKANNSERKKQKNQTNQEPPQKREMIIVGIGASAGGLPPLQAFFESMPNDTGMAFVVIIHLHPEHESHLAKLLQPRTQMPVRQVTDRVEIQPNHVYVIPPNRNITVNGSHLDTAAFDEPRGRRMPIDEFFRSLAQAHHSAAAAILSGSGTDGAVGVKDIKESGGLILAQLPEEAEYKSMPEAAIGTGLADLVLPVRELAGKLAEYARRTPQLPDEPDKLNEQQLEAMERILAQVHARTGHNFSQYKRSTILRRIQRRMQINGLETLEGYLGYLHNHPGEVEEMFSDVLINVTNFFRDRPSWEALAQHVIPALFEGKPSDQKIRVWSVGCASGEEAYTLAILLMEHAAKLDTYHEIQVFASDLDEGSLARAREGLYPSAIEADVSPERLKRFFTPHGNYYQVKRALRDAVLFTNHSILRDAPFSHLNLISCRNVLIYLQPQVQEALFDIFHYCLHPDGYLFLGSSESAEQVPHMFEGVDKHHRIYQAKRWSADIPHIPRMPLTVQSKEIRERAILRAPLPHYGRVVQEQPTRKSLEQQHLAALETYGPPSLLVDSAYNILHVSETVGRYLLQPKGPITREVLKLVRPELQFELRSALFQALEKGKAIVSKPVAVQFNGRPHLVVLSVRPRGPEAAPADGRQPERQALVVFLEDELAETVAGTDSLRGQAGSNAIVAHQEAEIRRLREQLQAITEEFESSNEEMKVSNAELQSINEEYRSATEELETSKEELQSVNEELQTVNQELKGNLEEISRAHSDLDNLMAATEVAILFLDRQLRIQRYTPVTREIFNIMPSDHGRPIAHLTNRLNYPELMGDAEKVLHKLAPVEREVPGVDGTWYLVRQRPYLTLDDRIDGVVITMIDITLTKEAEEAQRRLNEEMEARIQERTQELDKANRKLRQARDMFSALFQANPIPAALVRVEDGMFLDINPAYLAYFGYMREDLVGRSWKEIDLPVAPDLEAMLKTRLSKEGMLRDLELEIDHPSGETRTILASVQLIELDGTDAVVATFIDITERTRSEQEVRAVASHLTASEQTERHRISRILHDDLQQNIFAVKMQLMFLSEAIEKNDLSGLKLDLNQLDAWLAKAIATTRQLSIDLSPPILHNEGLAEAIVWLAAQMKEQYNLDVTVNTNGVSAAFEEDIRVLVFQAIREVLFNIVKYSGTLKASVSFEQTGGRAAITVSDLGKGFNAKKVMDDKTSVHGLRRLRDRLFLLGCTLKVESKPGQGTQITIVAPIKDIMA